jgi:hemerythrin-like domain-containing protein
MIQTLCGEEERMDTLGHQALVEHQILQHVIAALRLSLQWQVSAVGMQKKLSSVRFTAQSFQRHLERLLDLEEGGGYMQFVREQRPTLFDKVLALRHEHDEFRETLAQVMMSLDKLTTGDAAEFDDICQQLEAFLQRLDEHNLQEVELMQEAMSDVGGEG